MSRARLDEMMTRMKEWPCLEGEEEFAILLNAAHVVVRNEHLRRCLCLIYCDHGFSWMVRPVMDAFFNLVDKQVRKAMRNPSQTAAQSDEESIDL